MKQLVTFKISDGGQEYESFGIYDHKYSDKKIIKDFFSIDEMEEDYDYSDYIKEINNIQTRITELTNITLNWGGL